MRVAPFTVIGVPECLPREAVQPGPGNLVSERSAYNSTVFCASSGAANGKLFLPEAHDAAHRFTNKREAYLH